jgi:hypothetical protein
LCDKEGEKKERKRYKNFIKKKEKIKEVSQFEGLCGGPQVFFWSVDLFL